MAQPEINLLPVRRSPGLTGDGRVVVQRALTDQEKQEKMHHVEELVRYVTPAELGVFTLDAYITKLTAAVFKTPRFLQSLKGKNPYERDDEDDSTAPDGINAKYIRDAAYRLRGDSKLFEGYRPGTDLPSWQEFRAHDCVFAGIVFALGKENVAREEQIETRLSDVLNIARNELDDPVLVVLMNRLGWPWIGSFDNWDAFKQTANQNRLYIMSTDVTPTGSQSHVVVAHWDGNDWAIHDRQGVRRGLGERRPQFRCEAWEVKDTRAAKLIRDQLQ
jgi:hypothetical protein